MAASVNFQQYPRLICNITRARFTLSRVNVKKLICLAFVPVDDVTFAFEALQKKDPSEYFRVYRTILTQRRNCT